MPLEVPVINTVLFIFLVFFDITKVEDSINLWAILIPEAQILFADGVACMEGT